MQLCGNRFADKKCSPRKQISYVLNFKLYIQPLSDHQICVKFYFIVIILVLLKQDPRMRGFHKYFLFHNFSITMIDSFVMTFDSIKNSILSVTFGLSKIMSMIEVSIHHID